MAGGEGTGGSRGCAPKDAESALEFLSVSDAPGACEALLTGHHHSGMIHPYCIRDHDHIFESIDGKPWLQEEHGVEDCRLLGRLLARIHDVGTHGQLRYRRPIKPHGLLEGSLRFLVEVDAIHPLVRNDYIDLVQHLSALIAERCDHQQTLRIHGDCGHWNMLWADDRPVVFDFDDMAMGIAAQDLALLMNSLDGQTVRLAERQGIDHSPFIEGYREIRPLDSPCAALLNPLLALRVVHIDAWAASRLFDPAFQSKFSDLRSVDYWSRSIARMQQCLSRVEV